MQAIILAAGMGRRLGEYTKNDTKCMIPVNGIRLIDRLLKQLSTIELTRVIIVVGYKGDRLIKHIGHRYDDILKIEFANNPIYDKTNNIYSLSIVKKELQEDDTLLIESDLIFSDKLFKMVLETPDPNVALVAKYETWMDGTMVRIDKDNNIVNFIPKKAFCYDDVDYYYKTVNIYKFSKEFSSEKYVPFLDAYCKALGNNEYYEQVLRVITLLDNTDIKALPIANEKWYEIDDIQDLDIAETIFAEGDEMMRRFSSRYGGYWRFPNLLDFCYLVNPFFPTTRMKEELKANFDALLTEYPSGMSVNSLIAAKYFGIRPEYIVVGNGAVELIKSIMEKVSDKIGVIYPTFEEYPNRLDKKNIISYLPNNNDLNYTAENIIEYFESKEISSLLLINPDNPSGNFIPMRGIKLLLNWSRKKNIRIIIDESFVDFTDDFENNSLLHNKILETFHNLIVIKSISKSYGVPGLRLGVMASSDIETIEWMKKDVSIWNINSFAEFYLQIFSKYSFDYIEACHKLIKERNRFKEKLIKIPYLRVIPTQANYFCCEIIAKFSSTELALLLLSRFNIMIKNCNSKETLKGKNFIRISIRDKEDNDKLIAALQSI